jgi:hypothetical protein
MADVLLCIILRSRHNKKLVAGVCDNLNNRTHSACPSVHAGSIFHLTYFSFLADPTSKVLQI